MLPWELRIHHTSNKTMNENISKKGLTIFKKAYWYDHLKYIDEKTKTMSLHLQFFKIEEILNMDTT